MVQNANSKLRQSCFYPTCSARILSYLDFFLHMLETCKPFLLDVILHWIHIKTYLILNHN